MIKNNINGVIEATLVVSGIRKMYLESGRESLTLFNDDEPAIKFVRPIFRHVPKEDVPVVRLESKPMKLHYFDFSCKK